MVKSAQNMIILYEISIFDANSFSMLRDFFQKLEGPRYISRIISKYLFIKYSSSSIKYFCYILIIIYLHLFNKIIISHFIKRKLKIIYNLIIVQLIFLYNIKLYFIQ